MNKRIYAILVFFVALCAVLNFAICFTAVSRVRTREREFHVTEDRFVFAVGLAVSNFLQTCFSNSVQDSSSSVPAYDVVQDYVEGLVLYYRYSRGQWVARCQGSDFVQGDYYGTGLIVRVESDRFYVRDGSRVVVYRPRVPLPDASLRRAGEGARDESTLDNMRIF